MQKKRRIKNQGFTVSEALILITMLVIVAGCLFLCASGFKLIYNWAWREPPAVNHAQ